MLSADLSAAQPAVSPGWLSIVGIGEDGIEGLPADARELISRAKTVFGGTRHLALAASLIRGIAHPWPVPFDSTLQAVLALRGQSVCVLASGDPLFHGVGSLFEGRVAAAEVNVLPAASAFSLAAARLLWSLPETVSISLCGRPLDHVRPYLHPGTRILALTGGASAPRELARLLVGSGFGGSQLTVLEGLGGPKARVRTVPADAFDLDDISALNTVAIEVIGTADARVLPRASGLPDELFEHDGQITKREIRALTLSALAPLRGERLWDVGAGSGSVAIEWLLADTSLRAIAIEQRVDRAQRIARNASSCGVPHLEIVRGAAPGALAGLPQPDAVFIGGGALAPDLIEQIQDALRPSGRLVVNAVALATECRIIECQARWGGYLTRLSITHASPIGHSEGRMMGWRPTMPITQWVWVKP